jgi:hypothetical protein
MWADRFGVQLAAALRLVSKSGSMVRVASFFCPCDDVPRKLPKPVFSGGPPTIAGAFHRVFWGWRKNVKVTLRNWATRVNIEVGDDAATAREFANLARPVLLRLAPILREPKRQIALPRLDPFVFVRTCQNLHSPLDRHATADQANAAADCASILECEVIYLPVRIGERSGTDSLASSSPMKFGL